MKSKILFVDLDATLLCDDKSVSERNRAAIQRMLEEGHYFVIATGRSVESGRHVVQELGLTMPGCYMIAYNGAVIYDCSADRVMLKKSVGIEVVQELFDRAKKAGIYAQTYNNAGVITTKHTKELDLYCERSHMSYKLTNHVLEFLDEEPQKVLLIRLENDDKLEKFQRKNEAWAKDKCTSFFSCKEYLEYCPVDTDKGTGVEYLLQLLNIPLESSVAVGDEQNDISMIQAAHIGIAMKNGIDAIKKAADFVTENDNNHDAIAEVIERFIF